MSCTLTPNRDLAYSTDGLELYDTTIESLLVHKEASLTDYQGALFLNEAVEYMKYKEPGDGMEKLLGKMTLFEEPEKVSVLYEEKLKVEEELVAIDEGILQLMSLYDGIATSEKGLKVNKDGTLQTLTDYIKKICYGTVTAEAAGINNNDIFTAVAGNYLDPSAYFAETEGRLNSLDGILLRLTVLDTEIAKTHMLLSEAGDILKGLKDTLAAVKKDKTAAAEIRAQIEDCEAYISGLNTRLGDMEAERTDCEQEKRICLEEIRLYTKNLLLLVKALEPLILQADSVLDTILETSGKADPLIKGYEESVNNAKEELGEEVYTGLKEGLEELKRYQGTNLTGYDFWGMKSILSRNYATLTTVECLLTEAETSLEAMNYQTVRELFGRAETTLADYQIEGLTIDYSTLVIQKGNDFNAPGMIGDLIEGGLTGLVMDPAKISDSVITTGALPSDIASLSGHAGSDFDFFGLFADLAIGGKNSGLGSLFQSFGEYDAATLLGDAANTALEHLLYQAYLQDHFYRFPYEGEDISGRKPSVLSYEQEYLLMGNASDKDNLSSMVTRIILLRTIFNFTSLLGDKARRDEARGIAASLVGFTGLPILVSVTQAILIVVLAFAEALVDTCALLLGREVPLIKKRVQLNFSELMSLQREFIKAKALGYPEESKTPSLSYSDYLKIFLFIKHKTEISYRCMDLIQENIRIRYEEPFSMQNCLFGFEADAVFHMKPKFTALGFVQKYINSTDGFHYKVTAGYSY